MPGRSESRHPLRGGSEGELRQGDEWLAGRAGSGRGQRRRRDQRHSQAVKHHRSPYAALLERCLRGALRAADEAGITRRAIAHALEVPYWTFESWLKPSRDAQVPAWVVLELLCREDLLPEAARDGLLREIAGEAGSFVVPLPAGDEPVAGAVLEAARELGRLAEDVRAAVDAAGDGGELVTAQEYRAIGRDAEALAAHALGLVALCRRGGAR